MAKRKKEDRDVLKEPARIDKKPIGSFQVQGFLFCSEHSEPVPLVVMPQVMREPGASQRFWIVCPHCLQGTLIGAQFVKPGLQLTLPPDACTFNPEKHQPNSCDWCQLEMDFIAREEQAEADKCDNDECEHCAHDEDDNDEDEGEPTGDAGVLM